jgi:uncharacterized protein with FMN-binding domain
MRTRAAFLAGAGSAAIVALGWSMGAQAIAAQNAASNANSNSNSSSNSSSNASSNTTAGPKDGTYDGGEVDTGRYGTVGVKAVISGGKITDVVAYKLTDTDRKSIMISEQVAPMLKSEVISAQSANVSMIGGGTYTSAAYLQSLQNALDQAGFTG